MPYIKLVGPLLLALWPCFSLMPGIKQLCREDDVDDSGLPSGVLRACRPSHTWTENEVLLCVPAGCKQTLSFWNRHLANLWRCRHQWRHPSLLLLPGNTDKGKTQTAQIILIMCIYSSRVTLCNNGVKELMATMHFNTNTIVYSILCILPKTNKLIHRIEYIPVDHLICCLYYKSFVKRKSVTAKFTWPIYVFPALHLRKHGTLLCVSGKSPNKTSVK